MLGIRRQGKEDGVEVQDGGSARAQPLVPLCLFDKSKAPDCKVFTQMQAGQALPR